MSKRSEFKTHSIGVLLPQSGVFANLGNALRNGGTIAFQEAEAEFARLGFDLKLKNFDEEGSTEVALSKASRIVSDPTLLVAIGTATSESSRAITPFFGRRNLTVVNPFSIDDTLTEQGWTNVNRIVPRADSFTVAEADYVLDDFKAKNIILINDGSKLGMDRMAMMGQHFKQSKAKVLYHIKLIPRYHESMKSSIGI